ncbi:hypothetical protein EMCRGX_G001233 [Ephydatia muelleri]
MNSDEATARGLGSPRDWTTQWGSSCNDDATTQHRNGTFPATSTTSRPPPPSSSSASPHQLQPMSPPPKQWLPLPRYLFTVWPAWAHRPLFICSACRKEINALIKSVALSESESMDTAATTGVGESSNSQDQLPLNSPESEEESNDSSDESDRPSLLQKKKTQ